MPLKDSNLDWNEINRVETDAKEMASRTLQTLLSHHDVVTKQSFLEFVSNMIFMSRTCFGVKMKLIDLDIHPVDGITNAKFEMVKSDRSMCGKWSSSIHNKKLRRDSDDADNSAILSAKKVKLCLRKGLETHFIHPVTFSYAHSVTPIVFLLSYIEARMIANQLMRSLSLSFIDSNFMLQAITTPSADHGYNYERLETLGKLSSVDDIK